MTKKYKPAAKILKKFNIKLSLRVKIIIIRKIMIFAIKVQKLLNILNDTINNKCK